MSAAAGAVGQVVQPVAIAWSVVHGLVYGLLLWLFARSLRGGREALITGVARRVHGALAPDIEAYTRRVTIAWCVFFSAQLAVSTTLFAIVSWETWSLFTAVLNVPLLALMLVGEYGYRTLRYPHHPRVPILRALRAFGETAFAASDLESR